MSSDTYQKLIVGKGESVVEGKTHWKDFVEVHIDDHKEAMTVAMNILRQIEVQQHRDSPRPITFTLTGSLEPEDE